jgi:hypothetical protein
MRASSSAASDQAMPGGTTTRSVTRAPSAGDQRVDVERRGPRDVERDRAPERRARPRAGTDGERLVPELLAVGQDDRAPVADDLR